MPPEYGQPRKRVRGKDHQKQVMFVRFFAAKTPLRVPEAKGYPAAKHVKDEAPAALENTARVIQAMDLVLIAPLAVVGGFLLLRRQPWGYLLASVAVLKRLTMSLAVS